MNSSLIPAGTKIYSNWEMTDSNSLFLILFWRMLLVFFIKSLSLYFANKIELLVFFSTAWFYKFSNIRIRASFLKIMSVRVSLALGSNIK